MKKILIFAALGVLAAMGVVMAQSINPPQVSIINPTDLVQIIPRGQPSAQSVYAPPAALSSQELYSKVALTTASNYVTSPGYSNTFTNFMTDIMVTAPNALAYLYFTFAPNPSDGARECMYANQTVTAAYPMPNVGQTVNANNTITALVASTRTCFLFSASNLTWDRD